MRPSGRALNELRKIEIDRHYTCYAEGSVLIAFGNTKVLCNASFEPGVPRFLKGKGSGWLTAEYGMLPRSTQSRSQREAVQRRQGGRTLEIQRLIGRSLRAVIDLEKLGENTLFLDCDVIQADGGTRTAAITGAYIAVVDAVAVGLKRGLLQTNPITGAAASVSVGIYQDTPVLDLDYQEDLNAAVDMNVVMDAAGQFIEVQGTAEKHPFSKKGLTQMLDLAATGIAQLFQHQQSALAVE